MTQTIKCIFKYSHNQNIPSMGSLSSGNMSQKCSLGVVGFKRDVICNLWEIFLAIFLHFLEFHNCISHHKYEFLNFFDFLLSLSNHKVMHGLSSTRGQFH